MVLAGLLLITMAEALLVRSLHHSHTMPRSIGSWDDSLVLLLLQSKSLDALIEERGKKSGGGGGKGKKSTRSGKGVKVVGPQSEDAPPKRPRGGRKVMAKLFRKQEQQEQQQPRKNRGEKAGKRRGGGGGGGGGIQLGIQGKKIAKPTAEGKRRPLQPPRVRPCSMHAASDACPMPAWPCRRMGTQPRHACRPTAPRSQQSTAG